MQKLINMNKDRRFKLSKKETNAIVKINKKKPATEVAKKYNISRQRVSQLWSTEESRKLKNQKDTRVKTRKYREDKVYRDAMLEKKKQYYAYKVSVLKKC